MNTQRNIATAIIMAFSLCLGHQAIAQDEKPFYRGGFDGQIVEAPILSQDK
jgi:hypothetical protein